MLVSDLIASLEQIAPLPLAAEWDNVGMIAGARSWEASSVVLTIDLTEDVVREAIEAKANVIIAYHPPIFHPVKSLTDATAAGRALVEAMRAGIAIYSPHTALDAAEGGINDWLARGLGEGGGDIRAIEPFAHLPESEQCKIITFCPPDAVDAVRNGWASVGAGRIGEYQLCSFELAGRGTFLAGEGTNPTVGRRGEINRVDEIRLEMVCPEAALALAVTALRQFHPYEEPPIEIIRLQPRPQRRLGQGRRVVFDQPVTLATLIARTKSLLGVPDVQASSSFDAATHAITHLSVCAGAGGGLLNAAIGRGCQCFLTGELRHHDVLSAHARGCAVILAGHTNTERPYLNVLARRLQQMHNDLAVRVSERDVDPLRTT